MKPGLARLRTHIDVSMLVANLPLNGMLSISIGLLLTALRFSNAYAVYPLKRLVYWPLAALVLFFIFLPVGAWLRQMWTRQSARQSRMLLTALAVMPLAAWILPFPRPGLTTPHRLVISATGDGTGGTVVEIRRLAYLSGGPVSTAMLTRTADWQETGGVFYSRGAPASRLELAADLPGGVVVDLRYLPEGGPVRLEWDGVVQTLDLAARESMVVQYTFSGLNLFRLPLIQALLLAALSALQLVGLYAVILGGMLLLTAFVEHNVPAERRDRAASLALCAAIMTGLFLGFLYLKIAAFRADTPRVFRDTLAYAQSADLPLTSRDFWAGTRPFSLPLFFKLLGVNSQNYAEGAVMQRVAFAQLALSILSWTVLALVAAWCRPNRGQNAGIRPSVWVFGMVLFFSLSLEIGIWDSLLLSESLTFSLLALMLAGWLAVMRGDTRLPHPLLRAGLLVLTVLVMLLYTFTRDSNIYFVLGGLAVLLGGWLIQMRGQAGFRRAFQDALVLGVAAVLLFIGQNLSLSTGNRWQIFMYDHLAARFLSDPIARDFFAAEGLPLSDALQATTHMPGYEYQPLYYNDPAFQPVRDWVNTRSKAAYFKYLLTHPAATFLQPITNAPKLIGGSNLEYRSPVGGVQPAPARLIQLTAFFYDRQRWFIPLLALAALSGLFVYRRNPSPLWILVALLLLTLYPMMFLVWHGEPLEIERHAAQLGIQFYLAGWLALGLVVEAVIDQLLAISGRKPGQATG